MGVVLIIIVLYTGGGEALSFICIYRPYIRQRPTSFVCDFRSLLDALGDVRGATPRLGIANGARRHRRSRLISTGCVHVTIQWSTYALKVCILRVMYCRQIGHSL